MRWKSTLANLIIGLMLGLSVFIVINVYFELQIVSSIKGFLINMFDEMAENLGRFNFKRRTSRLKRESIAVQKENIFIKYNRFMENILVDFGLDKQLTLESLTSLIAMLFAVCILIITLFVQDLTFSFLIAISMMIGLFTYFSMQSRIIRVRRAEMIADAEDAICPLAHEGVLVAIKKIMENEGYIHKSLHPYFFEFIDNCDVGGYSFRQAMTLLNQRLGSGFDNFAKKAVIFEYNERKGMADIFMDIVDENAVVREINAKKEEQFRKMNRDFIMKIAIIVLFFLYALSIKEFREFMLLSSAGKLINSICLNVICISFAMGQSLQGTLELKRRDARKDKKG